MIIVRRRSSRSAIAPASGPSSSAGSRVATQTPPTAVVSGGGRACPAVFASACAASASSAKMLSQSPRLESDSAIHSRRYALIDSTPWPAGMVAPRGAVAGESPFAAPYAVRGGSSRRKAYRHSWPHTGPVLERNFRLNYKSSGGRYR